MFELYNGRTDIALVGDSIVQRANWDEFFPDRTIINRGIGSDTTEGVLMRIGEVLSHEPNTIVILAGINDISLGVPIKDSMENISNMIRKIDECSADVRIILFNVLPCLTISLDSICEFNNELCKVIEKSPKVEYIDCYSDFFVNGEINRIYYSDDGIHLNGMGYKVLIDALSPYI